MSEMSNRASGGYEVLYELRLPYGNGTSRQNAGSAGADSGFEKEKTH